MKTLPQTTFVCCVEAGPLEPMVLRLLESIRRHGGRFRDARVIICQPRFGPQISGATRARIRELSGDYVWLWRPRKLDWYHYLNKAVALTSLDPDIQTEWVTFLDSDMLVAAEPGDLVADDVDFISSAPDNGIVGSTGPGHPLDDYWLRYISCLGLKPSEVPMIEEYNTGTRIRLYFNSGLFSYRRSTGFAEAYKACVLTALRSRLGFPYHYEHYTDQVVLGLCVLRQGLRWRALPASYNLAVDRSAEELPDEKLARAKVLHYHKALEGDATAFLARLGDTHPDLASWMRPLGSLSDPRAPLARTASELLRVARGAPRRIYRAQVKLA
jgi:hypothetical protein